MKPSLLLTHLIHCLLTLACLSSLLHLDVQTADAETKAWWEVRNHQRDIFYPHNAHIEVMEKRGDSCLLCHSFNKTDITNAEVLKKFTTIINEPLEAVCHSCHVEEQSAPWQCDICHSQKESIWPEDHNVDYLKHHGDDAKQNEQACQSCHLDNAFCTRCHFQRQPQADAYHPLGYIGRHGLELRSNASSCGGCHNASYCSDCHRGKP